MGFSDESIVCDCPHCSHLGQIPSSRQTWLWKIILFDRHTVNYKVSIHWPFSIAMLVYQRENHPICTCRSCQNFRVTSVGTSAIPKSCRSSWKTGRASEAFLDGRWTAELVWEFEPCLFSSQEVKCTKINTCTVYIYIYTYESYERTERQRERESDR